MRERELTGLRRYRADKKGRIILQVQETYLHTWYTGGSIDTEWRRRWRDATLEDISVVKENAKEKQWTLNCTTT